MADDPAADDWHYPLMAIPGIGTASGGVRVGIKVSAGVCTELNAKAGALTATPAGFSIADLTTDTGTTSANATAVWPADLDGKPTGCFEVTGGGQAVGFYFYQVIGIAG